jgi:hypothetical protein
VGFVLMEDGQVQRRGLAWRGYTSHPSQGAAMDGAPDLCGGVEYTFPSIARCRDGWGTRSFVAG